MTKASPTCALALVLLLQSGRNGGVGAFVVVAPHHHSVFDSTREGRVTFSSRFLSSSDEQETFSAVALQRQQQQQQQTKNEVLVEAESALSNVGWISIPEEGELTADDPFVQEIDASIQRDVGVKLDELLNPAKVVNLERDLVTLRLDLAKATGVSTDDMKVLKTDACDGGGGGEDVEALRHKISKKEADLAIERRSVFRGWLKNVFLVQAVLSFVISYLMATSPETFFGQFDWYYAYNMDVSIKVLGYWWWWLFVVPSLRSRRPKGAEKQALDIAFLATPALSLVAPVVTKDTGVIWFGNLAVVAACYAFAYLSPGNEDAEDDASTPAWLRFVYKSLDFGSGRERGARK